MEAKNPLKAVKDSTPSPSQGEGRDGGEAPASPHRVLCTPTLARSYRSGASSDCGVAGHAWLRGRIPVQRGPCSTLRRASPW